MRNQAKEGETPSASAGRTPRRNGEEPISSDYIERINRAIDFVVRDLSAPLKLDAVAKEACFSPFHFHRIFKALMGETLNQFVKRQRLERALYLMSHASHKTLTEVALDCGFAGSSDFSRDFKQHYEVPPSVFDIETFRSSRRGELKASLESHGGPPLPHLPPGENPDGFEIELLELPARTVAYIRVLDPYSPTKVPEACERLVEWARERGLEGGQWLGYMWEDPEIVAPKDCRYDVAVVLEGQAASTFAPDGEVGRYDFSPMLVANLPVSGGIELEQRALDWLFGTWLPASGYEPDDQPAFEAWEGLPFGHGFEHLELSCQLAVRGA